MNLDSVAQALKNDDYRQVGVGTVTALGPVTLETSTERFRDFW